MIYYRVALECDKCSAQYGRMRTAMTASDTPFVAHDLLDQAVAAGWTCDGQHLCRRCVRRARLAAGAVCDAVTASVRAPKPARDIRRRYSFSVRRDPRAMYRVEVEDVPGADPRVIGTTKDERQAYEWELAEHTKAGCATRIVDLLTGQTIYHRKAERRGLGRVEHAMTAAALARG